MSYENNKKWRKKHSSIWQASKQRYYKQFEKEAHNKKQKWTIGDEDLVWQKKIPDRDIARLIGRSVKSNPSEKSRN